MTLYTVTATCGNLTVRHVGASIASCLGWGALMRDDGWQVTEPERVDEQPDDLLLGEAA